MGTEKHSKMTIADLSPEVVEQIKHCRYDRIIEKHEGPETWAYALEDADFVTFSGYDILLPIDKERHPNVSLLRLIVSEDRRTLTVFLKDTTHTEGPEDEMFSAGRLAVCDRFPGQDFYLTVIYHEWFIIEPPSR